MLRVRSAGMDVWEMIATGAPSPRKEAIIETHPEDAPPSDLTHGHALIVWPMKIIKVHMQNNEPGWYPPPGEDPTKTKYTMTVRPPALPLPLLLPPLLGVLCPFVCLCTLLWLLSR